ncbi:MAG: hypothetical protein ACYS9X_00790 [Planctomycetota bacterium]|jgi:hypothetical protein
MHRSTKWGRLCLLLSLPGALGLIAGIARPGPPDDPEVAALIAVFVAILFLPPAVGAVVCLRRARQRRALLAASGDRPWTLRADWREKRVAANVPNELAYPWLVAIGLIALSAVLILYVETGDEEIDSIINLIGWALGALAAVALLMEAVHVRRWYVHGRADLVLPGVPLVQGRRYSVSMRTDARVGEPGDVFARLEVNRIEGVGRDRRVEKLADESFRAKTADSHMEIERTVLPFEIALPDGLPDREDDEDPNVLWTLTVASDAFAARLKAAFDLPVFGRRFSARRDE